MRLFYVIFKKNTDLHRQVVMVYNNCYISTLIIMLVLLLIQQALPSLISTLFMVGCPTTGSSQGNLPSTMRGTGDTLYLGSVNGMDRTGRFVSVLLGFLSCTKIIEVFTNLYVLLEYIPVYSNILLFTGALRHILVTDGINATLEGIITL